MSKAFSFPGGSVSSKADISGLKGALLVACYNALTGATTKKFGSAVKGQEQTVKAYSAWLKQQGEAEEVEATEQTAFRPDSLRGKVILLASKVGGATYAALMAETKWSLSDLKSALHRIQNYNGLTVTTTPNEAKPEDSLVVISGTLRTRKAFDFSPKASQKECKPGSKRATTLEMLKGDGATFDEVKAKIGWDERTAYEGIRLLHSYLGYGIRETAGGKIQAFTK